jgi:hypothetical protein
MFQVRAREYVATAIGLSAYLGDDGDEEVMAVLLIFIAEIAIKISCNC